MKAAALACALTMAAAAGRATAAAQTDAPLGGVWMLNRSLSQVSREIGFSVPWLQSRGGDQDAVSSGGGRGRRGGSGGSRSSPATTIPRESYIDAQRVRFLTSEARNPPMRVTIVDTTAAVTITNELGQSRTLHPTGRAESIELEGTPFPVTSRREADRLIVVYTAEQGRDVRYTYSRVAAPPQLVVDVEFLERGSGDKARFVYEPGIPTTTSMQPAAPVVPPPATPAAAASQQTERFDARPGAELRGLTHIGILVEDLSSQARACGLDHDAIETALSKPLTDAGFTVRRNSDEDTYLYVNVITTTASSTGACTSRFDAFLYTHATARLSYTDQPVLVQVSLMHRGGIGTSAPAAHAAAVVRELAGYVDLLITQIRNANR